MEKALFQVYWELAKKACHEERVAPDWLTSLGVRGEHPLCLASHFLEKRYMRAQTVSLKHVLNIYWLIKKRLATLSGVGILISRSPCFCLSVPEWYVWSRCGNLIDFSQVQLPHLQNEDSYIFSFVGLKWIGLNQWQEGLEWGLAHQHTQWMPPSAAVTGSAPPYVETWALIW